MCHPLAKLVCHVVGLITAICAILVGLKELGPKYDILAMPIFSGSITYINYAFGIAGAIGLTLLILHFVTCGFYCGASCNNKKMYH